jgi:hypothetical protein
MMPLLVLVFLIQSGGRDAQINISVPSEIEKRRIRGLIGKIECTRKKQTASIRVPFVRWFDFSGPPLCPDIGIFCGLTFLF